MGKLKKSKYTRRRAIDCKLIERSKANPGYCKYMITIAELDGTIHKQPAYGKDMQDALSRLMKQEMTVKVERKLSAGWIFIIWCLIMSWPMILMPGMDGNPLWILYSFITVFSIFGLTAWWDNYIKKGE